MTFIAIILVLSFALSFLLFSPSYFSFLPSFPSPFLSLPLPFLLLLPSSLYLSFSLPPSPFPSLSSLSLYFSFALLPYFYISPLPIFLVLCVVVEIPSPPLFFLFSLLPSPLLLFPSAPPVPP